MTIDRLERTQVPEIWNLWNREVEDKYQLQERLMTQITDCPDLDVEASFVAKKNNTIIGAIIVKRWQRDIIDAYQHRAWISLLVVAKPYQRQGIGSQLLTKSIAKLQEDNCTTIHVGKGMNPLFCGIPSHWTTIPFFTKHGFVSPGMTYDMHRAVNDRTPKPLRRKLGYEIRLATKDDVPAIQAFFLRSFPGRWQLEFDEYIASGGTGKEFAIMEYENDVIAFCRINHPTNSQPMYNTNFSHNFVQLYGVGPLGVDDRYRNLSLGYDITLYTVNEAIKQGATDIIIDWTSHVAFYQKFGCDIWQEYVVLDRHL
jgi:predicted N-acetyltransferase YhbS